MFTKAEYAEIYMGKGAGKQILDDIKNATSEVKIVSPFLHAELLKELKTLYKKGVRVKIVTSDAFEQLNNDVQKDKATAILIEQNREVDKKARWKRNILKAVLIIIYCLLGGLFLFNLLAVFTSRGDFQIYSLLVILIAFLLSRSLSKKIKKIQIYHYHYKSALPLKIFYTPGCDRLADNRKFFLNANIYVIDHKIAYLGSPHFTNWSFMTNYENRIRFVDEDVVSDISTEVDQLLNNDQLPEISVQHLGRKLFHEAIN